MYREKALEILREHNPYGEPLENHCLRVAELTLALGEHRGVAVDEDLVFAIAYLHDLGLCVESRSPASYLVRGLEVARPHAESWGLDEGQLQTFEDGMLYNHSLAGVDGISPTGDLIRRAVQVEHSLGAISHGLPRREVEQVLARHPRRGFERVLLAFAKKAVLEDGPAEVLRIFFPTGLGPLKALRGPG
ncbi:MAG: HD domain-containing protein [Polyangia bacterium]